MRSIAELLELLKQSFMENDGYVNGLCLEICFMEIDNKLSTRETNLLERHLEINLPNSNHALSWPKGDIQSRINWLNKEIKIEKMDRDIIELLELLINSYSDNRNTHERIGLCYETARMFDNRIISGKEYRKIKTHLMLELPEPMFLLSWEEGRIEPRRKWVDQQIKKLKDEKSV